MEIHTIVMLFLVSGPLTLGQLRNLWVSYHLEWPVGSFEAFITEYSGNYVSHNSNGELELTAEGALHLHANPLLLSFYHAVTRLNAAGVVYRSFDSIQNECTGPT